MTLGTLRPITKNKKPKRRGRGDASGHGGTSTRGHKGQKARSGGFHKRGFEGGQMPLIRRIPKRGFTNIFKKEVGVVNLEKLSGLPKGTEVTLNLAKEKGWVSNKSEALKILGEGQLKHPLTIKGALVSKQAKTKIEAAGGTITTL
ncbi:MAG: 50S ribosomal protein L15 [Deltaproteobacteria bacterium RIFCSPLOWO2_01_44_7]|nr:MAG: 50S ribosomal protein L15 [Deltaproteobacteria bacterium RIFCSPHIGHO2_01_FULL_43_49]OGQ14973.1 MAG: 50S ribosomal protein L15 [Deltaproteobacteria bacterium RIFCSPHIGHO2_02_FULL_44_53]OGQ29698.1 MAG: 50S ribosomal protein L15 [Deltaproteobacteria bacterium RIFCSPHIGHO2_12_FULL_44_21]OGQ31085.1 MAG: 50S ribosomal protein L15 [Deltaproteobacteria bacterium RIFCSPLOWO2_01_FULL_45_74]OGQ41199.1 MAG: 50S ribosomal protein L15 [Deltaproteobacteria bacterium RIFCSPLOWO2_01_44_7]OGQ42687.1 MAG